MTAMGRDAPVAVANFRLLGTSFMGGKRTLKTLPLDGRFVPITASPGQCGGTRKRTSCGRGRPLRSAHCSHFRARRHSRRLSPSATRNMRPIRPLSGRRSRPRRTSSPPAERGRKRFQPRLHRPHWPRVAPAPAPAAPPAAAPVAPRPQALTCARRMRKPPATGLRRTKNTLDHAQSVRRRAKYPKLASSSPGSRPAGQRRCRGR